jgi:hypothetical protein
MTVVEAAKYTAALREVQKRVICTTTYSCWIRLISNFPPSRRQERNVVQSLPRLFNGYHG